MDNEAFEEAMRSKYYGTKALMQALSTQPLEFVFMLPAVSGVIGHTAQPNYNAGNTYLDSFANFSTHKDTHFFALDCRRYRERWASGVA